MAKTVLTTITKIYKIGTNNTDIYTYYNSSLKDLQVFIADTTKVENGISFVENELGYTKNKFDDLIFDINKNGELIVIADNPSAFSINSNGELLWTF